jgi:aminopeptidase N
MLSASFRSICRYSKGASLIRMLADIIGIDAFQKGLQSYIQAHK